MSEPIILERRGAVAIILINDAPYNRMTLEFMDRLEILVSEVAADDAARALVFTAEGTENFSVGMNLKQFAEGVQAKGSIDGVLDPRLRVIEKSKPWENHRLSHYLAIVLAVDWNFPWVVTSALQQRKAHR